jgi:tRNA1Val (adenine37-N6)-methyltransferase
MSLFDFKYFSLSHSKSTLKIGTDSVLLASVVPVVQISSLLDIGCGCGVISFCLAYKMALLDIKTEQKITGIDIDGDSVEEAMENLENFPKRKNQYIDFQLISLQEFSQTASSKFDLIVSNPPYFTNSLKPNRIDRVKGKHRDENLSFGDLIEGVCRLLKEDGCFYLILPPTEQEEFDHLIPGKLYLRFRMKIYPTPKKEVNRIISGYSGKKQDTILSTELSIRNENNDFSEEYKKITSEFYLRHK